LDVTFQQTSLKNEQTNNRVYFTQQVKDTVLPLLWFEEGLDELGSDLVDVIGQAVLSPPLYKNYLLCVLLGLGSATLVIGMIALAQLCLNRHRRFKHRLLVNQQLAQDGKQDLFHIIGDGRLAQVRHIISSAGNARIPANLRNPCGCFYAGHGTHSFCSAHQPMLLTSSTDSSRLTSASHSRNSSTGSTPPFVNQEEDIENRKSLLDPETKKPNTA
jgi:hypothetical protein